MRSRLLYFHDLGKYCQCLLLFQGLCCRAGALLLGTVELFQIALGQGVICLRTSKKLGFQFRSGEFVDKPVGTPDGVQWMRAPEWFVDPLSAIALAYGRFYVHWGVF